MVRLSRKHNAVAPTHLEMTTDRKLAMRIVPCVNKTVHARQQSVAWQAAHHRTYMVAHVTIKRVKRASSVFSHLLGYIPTQQVVFPKDPRHVPTLTDVKSMTMAPCACVGSTTIKCIVMSKSTVTRRCHNVRQHQTLRAILETLPKQIQRHVCVRQTHVQLSSFAMLRHPRITNVETSTVKITLVEP